MNTPQHVGGSARLTPRQEAFAQQYLLDLNAKQAAIRAGYSPRTAEQQGSRLLGYAKVAAAIEVGKRERSERLEINSDWVLVRLAEVAERCLQHVTPALGRDGRQLRDDGGAPLYRFDAAGANRALELIGRHVRVQAFEEHITVEHDLTERIIAARRRVSGGPVIDADYSKVTPAPARAVGRA